MERILLVDDDPLILQALGRILRNEGYEVTTHADPRQAALETNFNVVITDFMMPHLNGIELLAKLRAHNPSAVRLMITAASDFRVATEAVNRGEIFRLLAKPWAFGELTSCIREAVAHHRVLTENQRLQEEVQRTNTALVAANQDLERRVLERTRGLLEGMIAALDFRDTETQWHSRRVALYSKHIASAAGVVGEALDIIEQGAVLHDIGKIGVRDSILLKPTKLTPEEWEEMRLHPEIGYRMLARVPFLHEASLIVLQHQERWDGKGYPQGLSKEQIVIGARIFAIADTLDAITSDRPYRTAQPVAAAQLEIRRCAGTQFDPALVETFLRIPEAEWQQLRDQVAQLEAEELARYGPPIPRPHRT